VGVRVLSQSQPLLDVRGRIAPAVMNRLS
jgi:hypothetical protein